MSTCTPDSFSYLCTPAAAIFQNSLALLVTKASLRFAFLSACESPSLLLQEVPTTTAAPSSAAPIQLMIRILFLLKSAQERLAGYVGICERSGKLCQFASDRC